MLLCATIVAALASGAQPAIAASEPAPKRAVKMLNAWRAKVGVPPVAYDPAATRGCRAHANYFRINRTTGHFESPSRPGFTKRGQTAAQQSVLSYGLLSSRDGPYLWENAPYHRTGLLHP